MSIYFVIAIVAVAVVALLLWFRSYSSKQARRIAQQVFIVWAAQGPFESGEQSAVAMHSADVAVRGAEEGDRIADAVATHATSYDNDPAKWEETRLKFARLITPELEDFITVAKGLVAMDSLNKDFLEKGGHKLEFAKKSDGSSGFFYKKIWSDEAIEEKKKQDGQAIVSAIGEGLFDSSTEEARVLVEFLTITYKANTGEEPDSPSAIGRAWIACLELCDEEPESELAQEFKRLNQAYQATIPESEA